jgi:hypothetical protein
LWRSRGLGTVFEMHVAAGVLLIITAFYEAFCTIRDVVRLLKVVPALVGHPLVFEALSGGASVLQIIGGVSLFTMTVPPEPDGAPTRWTSPPLASSNAKTFTIAACAGGAAGHAVVVFETRLKFGEGLDLTRDVIAMGMSVFAIVVAVLVRRSSDVAPPREAPPPQS